MSLLFFFNSFIFCAQVGSRGIEASWAGGIRGREVMDRFFPMIPQLLSDHGLFYLVVVSDNDPGVTSVTFRVASVSSHSQFLICTHVLSSPDEIVSLLGKSGLNGHACLSRQAGRERLSILRFSKSDDTS